MIVGEGMAMAAALSFFVPWVPDFVKDIAIPVAVLCGASAIFLVAVFDKLDPTRPPIITGTEPPPPGPGMPEGTIYAQRAKDPYSEEIR